MRTEGITVPVSPVIAYGTRRSRNVQWVLMDSGEESRASGRPRDPEVERGILLATQDLLVESGYAGTTIAGVAQRAQCGKSAIYRRWSSKVDLVVAAVRALHIRPRPRTPGACAGT